MSDVAPITRERACLLAQLSNREWLDTHIDELQRDYSDRWVAVLDGKVVAHGNDVREIQRSIEEREAEAVLMRIPKDQIPAPI